MIPATGSASVISLGANAVKADESWEKNNQKSCHQIASKPDKLDFKEIIAINRTDTYVKGMAEVKDFRRVGIESQCNGIAIINTTRTILPRLNPVILCWHYLEGDKTQAYVDELPGSILLKGQILARTEQSAAGFPLIALTAEMMKASGRDRIYVPELITAPLTRQEYAQFDIQTSLDHFRTLFTDHLCGSRTYTLNEVVAGYNDTRPENALPLVIEDQLPENTNSHHPVGRPMDYSFYSDPLAANFWWTQANIAIPFKNIKNLQHLLNAEVEVGLGETIEKILNDSGFKSRFVEPLQANPYTDSWLWHFLYLSLSFGHHLGPWNEAEPILVLPKFRCLNLRYSHHQLVMEILDDEGIALLSDKILNDVLGKTLFINAIRKAVNDRHLPVYGDGTKQNTEFYYWLLQYLDDLICLCRERKKYGRTTVYNADTDQPFILVDQKPHYLPFALLNFFSDSRWNSTKNYYCFVLPVLINDSGERCTVLERRHISLSSCSVTEGEHHPFTSQSSWYKNPTEEEQKQLSLYWA